MYILGDIGNSETKVFLVNSRNKIVKNINFPSKKISTRILKSKFKSLIKNPSKVEKILFCSVVPKSFELIKKFLSTIINKRCNEVKDLRLKSLIKINVNYKQVGSDRLTNAISLLNNKDNFIILDFGTATTFDVVIKETYKGGVIAPGIKISLNTLAQRATLIPKINLKKIKRVVGIDTKSAVRSGFFWGYAGLIDNIVYLIKKETGKSFKLVITGGFSDLLKNSIKSKVIKNKDITIKGLIKISKLIK
tara:strand:- start:8920 stop:9666 length:747 start_codon:yes stop_codon:yes gene_type:complete